MSLELPSAPPSYSQKDQQDLRALLQNHARRGVKRGDDLDAGRIVRVSPDGTRWELGVTDDGETVWTEVSGTGVGSGAERFYGSVAEVQAASVPAASDYVRTGGFYSLLGLGGALYRRAASEPSHAGKIQSADGAWWELCEDRPNDAMFGVKADGSTDDSTAQNAFFAYVVDRSGSCRMVAGRRAFASQVTLTLNAGSYPYGALVIDAAGAEIVTTGAISGLKITGSASPYPLSIRGLSVWHQANASATYGVEVVNAAHVTLEDCVVLAGNGNSASYAAFAFLNSNPADSNTGSFWGKLNNCNVRKQTSAHTNVPVGVLLESSANQSTVRGGAIQNCDVGVLIRSRPGSASYIIPNGVLLEGVAVESCVTGVEIRGEAGQMSARGLKLRNLRFESLTDAISFTGATVQPYELPVIDGNYFVGGSITTYVNDANGILPNWGDRSLSDANYVWRSRNKAGHYFDNVDATADAVTVNGRSLNTGLLFTHTLIGAADKRMGWVRYVASTIMEIGASVANSVGLHIVGVRGISQTATRSRNLRGTVTLDAAGAGTVSFGGSFAEPDTSYFVTLGHKSATPGAVSWHTPTTSGFSVAGPAGAIVDWHLFR